MKGTDAEDKKRKRHVSRTRSCSRDYLHVGIVFTPYFLSQHKSPFLVAGFPARLLQVLFGHGTAAPSSLREVGWLMGGDPLRIHTDTLLARNGVIHALHSVL